MRVLMVSQFFAPVRGGEERMVEDLGNELLARGHDVAVATTTPTDRLSAGGLRVHRVSSLAGRLAGLHVDPTRHHSPPFPDPESVISLRRILAAERPDVVHAHNWLVHSLAPALGRRGPPLVLSLHDHGLGCATKRLIRSGEPCPGPRLDRCVPCASRHYGWAKGPVTAIALRPSSAAMLRRVGMCLPISDTVAEAASLARRGVPFEVMPDFIPDRLCDPPAPGSPAVAGLPRGGYIAFAGDLTLDKGIHTLLDAHSLLTNAPPLVLAGRTLKDQPIPPRPGVILLGQRPHAEVLEIFRGSLAVVVPSIWAEPFGLVALEAMATGSALIVSDTGALPGIVDHGAAGIVVLPGDAAALAGALGSLIASPERRSELGSAAAERARSFRASVVVPRVEGVYRRLLEGRSPSGVAAAPASSGVGR
jgi:glycosyltransferase involved in cell wall biosynthesis